MGRSPPDHGEPVAVSSSFSHVPTAPAQLRDCRAEVTDLAIALPQWAVGTFVQAGVGSALRLHWQGTPPAAGVIDWLTAFLASESVAVLALMAADIEWEGALPPLMPLPYGGSSHLYGVIGQGLGPGLDLPPPESERETDWTGIVVVGDRPLTAVEALCVRQQGALMAAVAEPAADPLAPCRDMAHQIQTPLSLLELYATLLEQAPETCAPSVMQTLGQSIQQIQDTLTRFCSDPDQQPHKDHQDLFPLLMAALQTLNPWIEAKGVQVEIQGDDLTVWCDRWQIHQVLLNVVNNAVQFSPPQGTLTFHWHRSAEGVLIQVQDQGPGVAEQDSQNMFQPAYSRREGGHGLGLAIARRFVLAHKGHIWAEALPAGGTQVSIALPN
jgi:signal transduction histidine kinase